MKKKVLIIEGHEGLRRLMSIVLSSEFHVFTVSDGIQALGWLGQGDIPDVILVESEMKDFSLEDFLATLHSSGIYSSIPVMIIGEDVNQLRNMDRRSFSVVKDFISLPVKPADMITRILRTTGLATTAAEPIEQQKVATKAIPAMS